MRKEYAIINTNIGDTEKDYKVWFKSVNPFEIVEELPKYDPNNNCVEEYTVDDDGEFYEGSNYDTFDHFTELTNDMIKVFGLDIFVTINDSRIQEYKTNDLYYEEAYQLEDGRWIAYDNAVNAWVMLG